MTGSRESALENPLVKIKLGNEQQNVEFLVDTGATCSVLNEFLMPLSKNFVMVKGSTGQPEKAYFSKLLKFKLGKQGEIHRFLYIPNSPKSLLGTIESRSKV